MTKEELLVWINKEIVAMDSMSDLSDIDKGWYNALIKIKEIYYD